MKYQPGSYIPIMSIIVQATTVNLQYNGFSGSLKAAEFLVKIKAFFRTVLLKSQTTQKQKNDKQTLFS